MNNDFQFSDYHNSDWSFDDSPRMEHLVFPDELYQLSLDILMVKTGHADTKDILQKAAIGDSDEFIRNSTKNIISHLVKEEFFERIACCATINSRISNFEDLLLEIILSALNDSYYGYALEANYFIAEHSNTAFDFIDEKQAYHLAEAFHRIILYTVHFLPLDIIHSSAEHVQYYLDYKDNPEEELEEPSFILGKKLEEKIPVDFPKKWLDYGDNIAREEVAIFISSLYTGLLDSDYLDYLDHLDHKKKNQLA